VLAREFEKQANLAPDVHHRDLVFADVLGR
jgi:hypothetical protein